MLFKEVGDTVCKRVGFFQSNSHLTFPQKKLSLERGLTMYDIPELPATEPFQEEDDNPEIETWKHISEILPIVMQKLADKVRGS